MKALILIVSFFVFTPHAFAVQPDEMLADPALEERAREISKDIRCVVCQNESIDDSNAGLAKKMRILVRERIVKGDSNQEVKDYLVSRYGDFVLLNPPFKAKTLVLWFGPAIMVLLGLIGVILYYRRRENVPPNAAGAAPLSEAEKARLQKLLSDQGEGQS